jgi:hypothetical protein
MWDRRWVGAGNARTLRLVPVLAEQIVNGVACGTTSAQKGIGLRCEWLASSFAKARRARHCGRVSRLKGPGERISTRATSPACGSRQPTRPADRPPAHCGAGEHFGLTCLSPPKARRTRSRSTASPATSGQNRTVLFLRENSRCGGGGESRTPELRVRDGNPTLIVAIGCAQPAWPQRIRSIRQGKMKEAIGV